MLQGHQHGSEKTVDMADATSAAQEAYRGGQYERALELYNQVSHRPRMGLIRRTPGWWNFHDQVEVASVGCSGVRSVCGWEPCRQQKLTPPTQLCSWGGAGSMTSWRTTWTPWQMQPTPWSWTASWQMATKRRGACTVSTDTMCSELRVRLSTGTTSLV